MAKSLREGSRRERSAKETVCQLEGEGGKNHSMTQGVKVVTCGDGGSSNLVVKEMYAGIECKDLDDSDRNAQKRIRNLSRCRTSFAFSFAMITDV